MSVLLFIFIICVPTILTQESRSSPEHYCFVQSPIDLSVFNLTTIQHEHIDSIVRINDIDYLRVHFCRPLKNPCNGKQDYAVCLHSNDKEIGVGKEPPKVAIENGKIMFRYSGDKCNKTHNYTVDIEMKCNLSIEKIDADLDIIYNRDQCGFQIAIETFAACAKSKRTTCGLTDESGIYYNLRPLMNHASNYKIKLNNTWSVILNVCHSLLYGDHFHQCDQDTMICLVDETNTKEPRYTRLGNVNDDMQLFANNGTVYMNLTSDTPCDEGDTNGLKTISTTIEFICNEDAKNALPKYSSGIGTCHYKFKWLTIAACNEDILIKHSEVNYQPCKITDPLDNEVFDLSMLEGNVFFTDSHDKNSVYQYSICGPLQKSSCDKLRTGVCKYTKDMKIGVSKGQANTNLTWRRNHIFLNYTDGVACGNNRRSYTTIYFKCSHVHSSFINEQDPCATIITLSTSAVCSHRCATPYYEMNLNKLRQQAENYHVEGETDTTEYHLNVCEPLVDEHYTNCTYGTGICKVIVNDQGTRISEVNLGYTESGLHTTKDGQIYLRYLNGSVCEEDNSKIISSKVTFTCDADMYANTQFLRGLGDHYFTMSYSFPRLMKMIHGTPTFTSYNNCKYQFNWRTAIVCTENDVGLSKECLVKDAMKVYNLTDLIENSHFKVNSNESSGYFEVNVCGNVTRCNGTFICDNRSYYEKEFTPTLNRAEQIVTLKFANKTHCKNATLQNSLMKSWCNLWVGVVELFLLNEGECSVLDFDKNNTCQAKGNVTEAEKEKNSSNIPSSTNYEMLIIISVVVASTVVAITMYYFRHRDNRILCINTTRNMYRYILLRREAEPSVDIMMQ